MPSFSDIRQMVPSRDGALSSEVDQALGFPDIRVYREANTVHLTWAFINDKVPPTYPETWTWSLSRCGSPGGPFTNVATDIPSSTKSYRDDGVPLGRENTRHVYYRVTFHLDDGDETFGYRPEWDRVTAGEELHGITWDSEGTRSAYAPGYVREMRQRFQMLVSHYGREPAALYREAWMDGPCPQCIDTLTGTHRSGLGGDYCRSCFGTGKIGGYYKPLAAEFIPYAGQLGPQDTGSHIHDLQEEMKALMPHWPIVEPRDVLRTRDGKFYTVATVASQDLHGFPALFIANLSQMSRTDALAQVPLPEELRNASRGPRRQYGRAMNLDAYTKGLQSGSMARAGRTLPTGNERKDW